MERIIRGRSATLEKTFYDAGGIPTNLDVAPTVTVTRADGTPVTTGAVTDEAAVGVYTVTIPATSNTLLDRLDVVWVAPVNGVDQEHRDVVEVAGGYLFTIAEARAIPPLNNTTAYPEATIVDMRTLVEQALEDACGVAFVPRYTRETVDGTGDRFLGLEPVVTRMRSLTINGVEVTAGDIAARPTGVVYHTSGTFGYGYGNVIVGYEHGYAEPPGPVRQAALLLAKTWLVQGPIDQRTTAMSTEDGTFTLATPGLRGSLFGVPQVDATVNRYSMHVGVA